MSDSKNLNWYLQQAKEKKFAIPHFNFASAEQLEAIVLGFKKVLDFYNLPYDKYALMVGTSEGEAKFLGLGQARALVDSWKKETNIPIFLNADHHKSFESCKEAISAGYDAVLIDPEPSPSASPHHSNLSVGASYGASASAFEERIRITHKVVDYAKSVSPEITVEGELGYLRGESKLQETVEIKPEDFTKPEDAKEFVEKTGVDRLAVAIGNIHGILTSQKMELDFDLLKKINKAVPQTNLVLHGGSGLADEDFKKSIQNGIVNIHINTEVRIAYRQGLDEKLKEAPKETTPYKFLEGAVEKMREVVEEKVKVFLNL